MYELVETMKVSKCGEGRRERNRDGKGRKHYKQMNFSWDKTCIMQVCVCEIGIFCFPHVGKMKQGHRKEQE